MSLTENENNLLRNPLEKPKKKKGFIKSGTGGS
jgi:hypothetical protein